MNILYIYNNTSPCYCIYIIIPHLATVYNNISNMKGKARPSDYFTEADYCVIRIKLERWN